MGRRAQAEVGEHGYDIGYGWTLAVPGEPHRQGGGTTVVGAGGGKTRFPTVEQRGRSCLGARAGVAGRDPVADRLLAHHVFSIASWARARTPACRGR